MRKNGGFIPGIRPGRTTSDHVSRILKRLTFIGAIYLALVCLLPEWIIAGIHLDHSVGASADGLTATFRSGSSKVSAFSFISAALRC